MDLSSSGLSPRRKKEQVTLLSYANNESATSKRRYAVASTPTSALVPPVVAKKSEKFFRTLRKRSKSASRLNKESISSDFGGSDFSLNNNYLPEDATSKLVSKEKSSVLSDIQDKVTLVGFASNLDLDSEHIDANFSLRRGRRLDFGGSAHNLSDQAPLIHPLRTPPRRRISPKSFSTLKTSREVKMERERLRQERLGKLNPSMNPSLDPGERMTASRRLFSSNIALPEDRTKFFEEARDKFFNGDMCAMSANDLFSQFVRENQERFAQLVAQHRHFSTSTSSSTCLTSNSSCGSEERNAVLTAFSSSPSSSSSSSSSSNSAQSAPKVHHIEIKRECSCEAKSQHGEVNQSKEQTIEVILTQEKDCHSDVGSSCSDGDQHLPHKSDKSAEEGGEQGEEQKSAKSTAVQDCDIVQRSLSTSSRLSSSSSSGFSSIEGSSSTYHSKLQQLQERRNKSSFHHPTFTNHFGFFGRVKNFNESSSYSNLSTTTTVSTSLPRRGSAADVVTGSSGSESRGRARHGMSGKSRKSPVTKSKSVSADFRNSDTDPSSRRDFR